MRAIFATVVFTGAALAAGCSNKAIDPPAQAAAAPADAGKIPITTSAEGARQEFLEGRSLAERLRVTDSIAHFDKAIALDPSFGLAELARANASPTGTEFLAHLAKAVAAADRLSDGEKLQIAAANAGANARGPEQRRLLEQLVAAYPQDERAHFALGAVLFGQQDPAGAIEHFKNANTIAPNYSAPYNQMGYAYRQLGDFANAEQAFKKYIELIPNDPNPYDSYAELLMKMGRFDDSIAQYRKALSIDEHFLNSHMGIAADLMYQNKAAEAAAEAAQIVKKARTDGGDADRHVRDDLAPCLRRRDGRRTEEPRRAVRRRAEVERHPRHGRATCRRRPRSHRDEQAGRRAGDVRQGHGARRPPACRTDQGQHRTCSITTRLRAWRWREGRSWPAREGETEDSRRSRCRAARSRSSRRTSWRHDRASGARTGTRPSRNWDQASQQNAYNLYRMCLAYQGKGDAAKAAETRASRRDFNPLPELNFSFIHAKAAKSARGEDS